VGVSPVHHVRLDSYVRSWKICEGVSDPK